jgi:hypothetical protein
LDEQPASKASIAPAQITMNGFFILSPLITTAKEATAPDDVIRIAL